MATTVRSRKDQTVGWTSGGGSGQFTLFRTISGGATWQAQSVALPPGHSAAARLVFGSPAFVTPTDGILAASVLDDLKPAYAFYVSRDSGVTWTLAREIDATRRITAGLPAPYSIIGPDKWVALLPTGETIYSIDRQSGTFSASATSGLPTAILKVSFATETAGWALSAPDYPRGRLFGTSDGGRTWKEIGP